MLQAFADLDLSVEDRPYVEIHQMHQRRKELDRKREEIEREMELVEQDIAVATSRID